MENSEKYKKGALYCSKYSEQIWVEWSEFGGNGQNLVGMVRIW